MPDREYIADVVVIGGGGSGLAAAIEARTLGRDVILLEKNPFVGGSTIRSIGSVSATNTPHQKRKGIKDTPEEHFEDLGKFNAGRKGHNGEDNEVLRRILVENVTDTFYWLESLGVVFFGPTPEPPHRKPRMHNVLPNSRAYGYHLGRHARKIGVDIRTERCARNFILKSGEVQGIECSAADGTIERYVARGGTVLATGDYSASQELKALFGNPRMSIVGPTNPANTGDGHVMAMEQFGTRVINGNMLSVLVRFVPPKQKWIHAIPPWRPFTKFMAWSLENMPSRILRPFVMSFLTTVLAVSPELFRSGAILVNQKGERFTDELDAPVYDLAQQAEQTGYIIFDHDVATKFSAFPHFVSTAPGIAYAYVPDYRRSRPDVARRADTLADLAAKIGADPATLEKTVAERNALLRNGGGFAPISKGPFYSFGPMRSYVNITDGGLAIDEQLRVLDRNNQPVPRLFAAGSAGQGGMMLEGHGHHLGWAFTSGRIAGRNASFLMSSADL